VRLRLTEGQYGPDKRVFVERWLREKAAEHETGPLGSSDDAEGDARHLALQANRLARDAFRRAGDADATATEANRRSTRSGVIGWVAIILSLTVLAIEVWLHFAN
jgi:hypothetical protein